MGVKNTGNESMLLLVLQNNFRRTHKVHIKYTWEIIAERKRAFLARHAAQMRDVLKEPWPTYSTD